MNCYNVQIYEREVKSSRVKVSHRVQVPQAAFVPIYIAQIMVGERISRENLVVFTFVDHIITTSTSDSECVSM